MENLKQYQMIIDYIDSKEVKQPVYELFKIIIKHELQNDFSYPRYDWPNQLRLQILTGRTPEEYVEIWEDISDEETMKRIEDEIMNHFREIPETTVEDLEKIQKILLSQFSNFVSVYRPKYQTFMQMYTDEYYPEFEYDFQKFIDPDEQSEEEMENQEDIDDMIE